MGCGGHSVSNSLLRTSKKQGSTTNAKVEKEGETSRSRRWTEQINLVHALFRLQAASALSRTKSEPPTATGNKKTGGRPTIILASLTGPPILGRQVPHSAEPKRKRPIGPRDSTLSGDHWEASDNHRQMGLLVQGGPFRYVTEMCLIESRRFLKVASKTKQSWPVVCPLCYL